MTLQAQFCSESREQHDEDLFTSMLEIICYEEVPSSIGGFLIVKTLMYFSAECWNLE